MGHTLSHDTETTFATCLTMFIRHMQALTLFPLRSTFSNCMRRCTEWVGTHVWKIPQVHETRASKHAREKKTCSQRHPTSVFSLRVCYTRWVTLTRQFFAFLRRYWALVKVSTFLSKENENPQTVRSNKTMQWQFLFSTFHYKWTQGASCLKPNQT